MKPDAATACVRLGVGLALLSWSRIAPAQQVTSALGMSDDPIALPGFGRIVLAFVVVAALAVAAVLALRRFGPQLGRGSWFGSGFASGFASRGSLRVLERLQLSRELTVHLVQTERGKVLITAHRHSIAVVALDGPLDSTPPGGQP